MGPTCTQGLNAPHTPTTAACTDRPFSSHTHPHLSLPSPPSYTHSSPSSACTASSFGLAALTSTLGDPPLMTCSRWEGTVDIKTSPPFPLPLSPFPPPRPPNPPPPPSLQAFLAILLAAMGLAQSASGFPDLGKAKVGRGGGVSVDGGRKERIHTNTHSRQAAHRPHTSPSPHFLPPRLPSVMSSPSLTARARSMSRRVAVRFPLRAPLWRRRAAAASRAALSCEGSGSHTPPAPRWWCSSEGGGAEQGEEQGREEQGGSISMGGRGVH